jgi:hypothetical protein
MDIDRDPAERFPGAAENAPELETAEEVPRRP